MPDIRQRYPTANAETLALTITIASLATDTNLRAGRQCTTINNTTNVDLDHLISGKIRTGTGPTLGRPIELWAFAPWLINSGGTASWPDTLAGTDANVTITSDNVKFSMLRLVWSTLVDATSDRDYFVPPTSIASLFGDMPAQWGLFLVQNTGVALNATGGNHALYYQRIQRQSV